MSGTEGIVAGVLDAMLREATLFAAVGFLIGGIDDLLVDIVFFVRRLHRRLRRATTVDQLRQAVSPNHLAVFVPAWDEATVIGSMVSAALGRFDHPDYRIYVGCYPNDLPTVLAVVAIAARDARVRVVVGERDGPTTKADCLNSLWRAMRRDAPHTRAVVLHDAEDVVHPDELTVFDALLEDNAVVQLPVLPLIDHKARLVSGHYADEFAESHGKQMVVRAALGAGLPLAGTGCAVAVSALERLADDPDAPFDATSLTEDYELGLRIASLGLPACFARVRETQGGPLVAVRAYFPASVAAAVTQKSRWMTGIALAGWDRVGWGRALQLADHWMRMRDRRAPVAVLVLAAAYAAVVLWPLAWAAHAWTGLPTPAGSEGMRTLLYVNAALLAWRLAMRTAATARTYGWREGLWAIPRVFVANVISLLAARRAVMRYAGILAGATPRWDKTAHVFPATLPPTGAVR